MLKNKYCRDKWEKVGNNLRKQFNIINSVIKIISISSDKTSITFIQSRKMLAK